MSPKKTNKKIPKNRIVNCAIMHGGHKPDVTKYVNKNVKYQKRTQITGNSSFCFL